MNQHIEKYWMIKTGTPARINMGLYTVTVDNFGTMNVVTDMEIHKVYNTFTHCFIPKHCL
jgi:hypothetical protein